MQRKHVKILRRQTCCSVPPCAQQAPAFVAMLSTDSTVCYGMLGIVVSGCMLFSPTRTLGRAMQVWHGANEDLAQRGAARSDRHASTDVGRCRLFEWTSATKDAEYTQRHREDSSLSGPAWLPQDVLGSLPTSTGLLAMCFVQLPVKEEKRLRETRARVVLLV